MVLTDDIVSYYKFDETSGTAAVDSTATSNDMTHTGATINQAGKIDKAVSYDGSNDYSRQDGNLTATADASYNFWMYSDGTKGMIYNNIYSSSVLEFIGIDTGAKLKYTSAPASGSLSEWKLNDAFPTNEWFMVTVTTTGTAGSGTTKIYLNGVEKANTYGTVGANRARPSGSNRGYLAYPASGWGDLAYYYKGLLDEFAIWSRVLTTDEITELYNSGTGKTYPFTISATVSPTALSRTITLNVVGITIINGLFNNSITGTINTAAVKTSYPVQDGLTAATNTQQGHVMNLEYEKSFVPSRTKVGL